MIDDGRKQAPYFPGDFAYQLNPSSFDSRVQGMYWTERQIHEYQQTIICLNCKLPCAGTCLVSIRITNSACIHGDTLP